MYWTTTELTIAIYVCMGMEEMFLEERNDQLQKLSRYETVVVINPTFPV